MEPLGDRIVPVADVTVSAFSGSAIEGGYILWEVIRSDTVGDLTVNLSTGGTATSGTDYVAIPSTIVIPDGSTSALYITEAIDDSASELTESLTISVAPGTGYNVGTPTTATVLILDNDAQIVSVAAVNDAVEDGTAGKLRFTRTGALTSSLTANYSVGGTATSGTDFTALSGTVTFAAGASTADVTVTALHDGVIDDDETVSVTVTSGTGYTVGSPSSDSITIVDTEFLPLASDAWRIVSVNKSLNIAVLDLAVDTNGDELTATAVTDGLNGTVVINLDGTVTYTPDTDFVGDDTFTYTVEDAFGNESTGTIFVSVAAPSAPPIVAWTPTNTAVTVEVLELAFDPDGDTLTTTAVTQGANGTVVINLDGTVTYTPNTSFTGDDSFTYTVEDPDGNEATHTITVTVGPIDPIALDTTATTAANTTVGITVLDFSYQPAGGSLTTTAVTQGAHGTVVINLDGTVTYTPDTGYTGTDSFTYTVTDGGSNTATGTVTVTVGAPTPTAGDAIIADLGDIEDLVAGYTTGSADDIADAVGNIVQDIDDYLDDVTALISVNSVGTLGAAKDYAAYQPAVWKGLMEALHPAYMVSLDTEALLWNILQTLTTKLNGLLDELKATTLPVVGDALLLEIETLRSIHGALEKSWEKVTLQIRTKEYRNAATAWAVGFVGLPEPHKNAFMPPYPPSRNRADITYKLF